MNGKFWLESSVSGWYLGPNEWGISIGPLHSSSQLDAPSQANLPPKPLSLSPWGDGHATYEDHGDLVKLTVMIKINPTMVSLVQIMRRQLL
jgi:hypothetical protein